MYVLVTADALYYDGPLRTYPSHEAAFRAACKLGISLGWFDIERIW